RRMLQDKERGPVLVMATMWPEYWNTLTARPEPGELDRYAQARELLATATEIRVPEVFSEADLRALKTAADTDPRLRHAAEHSEKGRITQHLAGVPELERRYRNAPAAARAVLEVAIDARRLGYP